MTTFVTAVEYAMYALAALGIGAASYGIYSVARAFSKKEYLLLRNDASEPDRKPSAHS